MELLINEVKDMAELKLELLNKNYQFTDYQVAVIAYIFDQENRIIFQRRGPACRDERLKLETIGGRVKENDADFKTALNREIIEEIGADAKIKLGEFITATYATTFDERYNKEQNWIYIVYKGNLLQGEPQIAEPDKCLGYERYKIGEVDEKELSNGAKELYGIVKRKD